MCYIYVLWLRSVLLKQPVVSGSVIQRSTSGERHDASSVIQAESRVIPPVASRFAPIQFQFARCADGSCRGA